MSASQTHTLQVTDTGHSQSHVTYIWCTLLIKFYLLE